MKNKGENHHSAKLTQAKVRAMRYLYWVRHVDCRCLTKFYDVSIGNCWDVVNMVTWKHVADSFTPDQIVRKVTDDYKTQTEKRPIKHGI